MNKRKHKEVQFCDFDDASVAVNNSRFVSLEEINENVFEVCAKFLAKLFKLLLL